MQQKFDIFFELRVSSPNSDTSLLTIPLNCLDSSIPNNSAFLNFDIWIRPSCHPQPKNSHLQTKGEFNLKLSSHKVLNHPFFFDKLSSTRTILALTRTKPQHFSRNLRVDFGLLTCQITIDLIMQSHPSKQNPIRRFITVLLVY